MSRVTATQRTSEKAMLTGLKQRGTRWSLRRRVPADLVEAWGQPEVTRSLRTSDYSEARKLLPKAWATLDEEFDALRAKLAGSSAEVPTTPQPSPGWLALSPAQRDDIERAELEHRIASAEWDAHDLAELEADPERLRVQEAVQAARERWEQEQRDEAQVRSEAAQADENPTTSEVHTLWLKYQERPPSTVKEMQRAVDRFKLLVGDKRVRAIKRSYEIQLICLPTSDHRPLSKIRYCVAPAPHVGPQEMPSAASADFPSGARTGSEIVSTFVSLVGNKADAPLISFSTLSSPKGT